MRTDVKVGVALGAIILIIAVSYYGTKKEGNIKLKDGDVQLADADERIREQNSRTLGEVLSPAKKPAKGTPQKTTRPRPKRATPPATRAPQTDSAKTPTTPAPAHTAPASIDNARQTSAQPGSAEDTSRSARSLPQQRSTPQEAQRQPAVQKVGRNADLLANASRNSGTGTSTDGKTTTKPPARYAPSKTTRSSPNRRTSPQRRDLPARPQGSTHVIARGDSFAKLAERYYGGQRHANFLVEANPDVDPYHMKIGSTIRIPPLPAATTTAKPAPQVARSPSSADYVVAQGDTLYGIAASHLGSGARWPEIYELNRDMLAGDPSRLKVGQHLLIPKR